MRVELRDCFELLSLAGERLKAAGFMLIKVSGKSEACYYQLPGRHGLLRVALHHNRRGPIGEDQTIVTLTFRGGRHHRTLMNCSEERFEQMLCIAIGQYILRSTEPKPSRYQGKRGTWEADALAALAEQEAKG